MFQKVPGLFSCFMGVFEGVLENVDGNTWCFCGEVVVKCVVNVVRKRRISGAEK
jgi:hypothetical protein